jgi:penicillin amidase
LEVFITRHGPIMNEVLGDLGDAEPLALRWTALEGLWLFRSVLWINLASNWDEFREALSYWEAPSQNFVYADAEGNIGYQTPGKIPIRVPGHEGVVPVPGWTGEYEWQGFIPFEELPYVFNPPTGFVATANNKVVPDDYPYLLTHDWSPRYRAQRISDLLAADDSVTMEDMRDIHAQTYSLPAEALRPYLLAVEPEGDMERQALELVRDWDLYMETDRAGASIYHVWYWFMVRNTFGDEMDDSMLEAYLGSPNAHMPAMEALVPETNSPWFDDKGTAQIEICDDMAKQSLADAVGWLSEHYGDDPAKWEWGRLHSKTFVHQPLGQSGIGLLENLFNSKTIAARGDPFTVDAAWFSFNAPCTMSGGASQRYIADLSDLGNSLIIHTTGQSGHLFHRHREDFISMWESVEYHPMIMSREAAEANAEGTLRLTPP